MLLVVGMNSISVTRYNSVYVIFSRSTDDMNNSETLLGLQTTTISWWCSSWDYPQHASIKVSYDKNFLQVQTHFANGVDSESSRFPEKIPSKKFELTQHDLKSTLPQDRQFNPVAMDRDAATRAMLS